MRKTAIILAAFGVTVLAYWGYIHFSGVSTLDPPSSMSQRELDLPETDQDAQRFGQTVIHGASRSRYVYLDPDTKTVKRVFGFAELKTDRQSARWQVEQPYMIFYESGYQYRIDADSGLIQVEHAGGTVSPQDAQLDGNVVIHLTPAPGSQAAEATLLLDDLLFSSERTELSTDGPVELMSAQIEMVGRGLVLLFNADDEQIDYLHILDLESLRLKDVVRDDRDASESPSPSPAGQPDGRDAEAVSARAPLYECLIEDNVRIQYGDQLVVAGADRVNIQNILWRRQSSDRQQPPKDSSAKESPDSSPSEAATPRDAADGRDVVVTCDGGIVLRLMEAGQSDAATPAMAVEMNGAPLRIDQIDPAVPNQTRPLVYCGLLHYDLTSEVLKLFTDDSQRHILLGDVATGRIETRGPVLWDRRANQAQVVGPGRVFLDSDDSTSSESGEITFAGQMELIFADAPRRDTAMQLSSVNLLGGMSARLSGRGEMTTAAETAYLAFGPENALTSARLDGAVRFENTDTQNPSVATSHTAVLHFDDDRQLARADLSGDVQFASDSGHLQTDAAMIAFGADSAGAVQPTQFVTSAQATLETAAAEQPPTRFEAQAISYDLLTGSGRATGPVKFVFYQTADAADTIAPYWPVQIDADGDTEFIAGDNRQIETVVFNRAVRGQRTQSLAAFTQTDAFTSDTMVVDIARNEQGAMDIAQITLRDGDVTAESIRTHESLKLAHTRLTCRQIVFSRQPEAFTALGPGHIEMDNSQADPSASSQRGLDLRGPSYAQIKGFDSIEWTAHDRRIVAAGADDMLELAYIPLTDGAPDRVIRASGGRVEVEFDQDADGGMQIARMVARDRVFFEEQDKHILEGYALHYDAAEGNNWLTITGSESRPCMVNGARVPYIHYNMLTGDLETQLSTIPGAIPIP